MPRIALVVNPESGSGTDPSAVAGELRRHGAEVETFAREQAERAVESGADRLAVAGGDGSIANAAAAAGARGLPLAVLPSGTANDFATAMELPEDLTEACRLAVQGESLRSLDLGRIDGRPFVNVASVGLAAPAARQAGRLKRLIGPLAYGVGALRAGLTERPLRCRLVADGAELFAGRAWQVTIANSGAFGGGSTIETADPADGRLDAAVIEAGPRPALVRRAYGLRAGRITAQAGVHAARASSVRLEVPGRTAFNVDGELEPYGPVEVGVERAAFELVVG